MRKYFASAISLFFLLPQTNLMAVSEPAVDTNVQSIQAPQNGSFSAPSGGLGEVIYNLASPNLGSDHSKYAVSDVKITRLTDKGGRVAWYKESAGHELIAFDAITDIKTGGTDIFVMNPDGSGRQCLTCGKKEISSRGFIGQPEWHPGGEYIVFGAENKNSQHTRYNHVSWGINDDLWIIKKDGSGAQKIWETKALNGAALHPQFSEDGKTFMFAERVPTKKKSVLFKAMPGSENAWDGWRIHLADADLTKSGEAILSNHRFISPRGRGFYETHDFTKEGNIIFSFTPNGLAYVDGGFVATKKGKVIRRLTDKPLTWNEHAMFSPSGKAVSFISSRFLTSWRAPKNNASTVRTELYLAKGKSQPRRLTFFNKYGTAGWRYLVSDYDWDKSGTRVAFQMAPMNLKTGLPANPEIWLITFSGPQ